METTAVRRRLTWQNAAVTSTAPETDSVATIELDPQAWPGHRAGQHLDVRLTAEDGYAAERSYSIASAPGEPLAITVERLEAVAESLIGLGYSPERVKTERFGGT
jgi:ferredoxin-NADP reductase